MTVTTGGGAAVGSSDRGGRYEGGDILGLGAASARSGGRDAVDGFLCAESTDGSAAIVSVAVDIVSAVPDTAVSDAASFLLQEIAMIMSKQMNVFRMPISLDQSSSSPSIWKCETSGR